MVIQIYGTPNDDQAIRDLKKGDINDALSYEYEPFFCGAGTFTLELPLTTPFATELVENNLLYIKEDDTGLIIKNVKRSNDKITVVGYDLNGMLLDRITMERDTGIDGAEGKDCISGSTETCVKHFVEYNMISSPDIFRNYPRLAVAEDLGRGIANDSDLVGKECLEDVVRTLCEGAGLGYRIKLVMSESQTEPLLIFDVYEREDHTADQSERNRVIFSEGMGNLTQIERETGITAEKNAVWCDTGGENMFVYKTDEDGEPFNPVSWDRREEYISLSVTDSYDTEEIELTARKQMADKYAQTDSLTIEAGNPLDYGTVYKLGDIVTVYDKKRSLQLNSVISSVLIKRSGEEHSVQITLGERKPKLLDKYVKQNQLQRKAQTDFPPTQSGMITHGKLESYSYISDNSIEYNGLTYTVEKNSAGLISKISDSNGAEFSPVVGGSITDVDFHNAVLTAVAMLCGLTAAEPVGYFDTLWAYNETLNLSGYDITYIIEDSDKTGGNLLRIAARVKIYLACDTSRMSRGNYGIRMVVYTGGGIKWYRGVSPDQPTLQGEYGSIWQAIVTNTSTRMYINSAPYYGAHPAINKRVKYGERFTFVNNIKHNEIFKFSETAGDISGVMIYKWGNKWNIDCFLDGTVPIMDTANSRYDRGISCMTADLSNYYDDGTLNIGKANMSVKEMVLTEAVQYGTSYFSDVLNNLTDRVYFNTFDLCDENGNVLLPANCSIYDFI